MHQMLYQTTIAARATPNIPDNKPLQLFPTAALEGAGDALVDTAAPEDVAERLVLSVLGLVPLDDCEMVLTGVERLVVVSMEVDEVTLSDEDVVDVDESVTSVELVASLSVEDIDIGIVSVVVGRGFKDVELYSDEFSFLYTCFVWLTEERHMVCNTTHLATLNQPKAAHPDRVPLERLCHWTKEQIPGLFGFPSTSIDRLHCHLDTLECQAVRQKLRFVPPNKVTDISTADVHIIRQGCPYKSLASKELLYLSDIVADYSTALDQGKYAAVVGNTLFEFGLPTSSSEFPMTVVANFYDPLHFYDPVEVLDPFWIVTSLVPSMLHASRGTFTLRRLGLRAALLSKGQNLYNKKEGDNRLADCLREKHCDAIFTTFFFTWSRIQISPLKIKLRGTSSFDLQLAADNIQAVLVDGRAHRVPFRVVSE
ncbi:hypothetical protein EDD18DRAFT_1331032, partial [Armillaria luteobubalina]